MRLARSTKRRRCLWGRLDKRPKGNYVGLTQVGNSSNILGDLIFGIFPETA
jgi:hypothetical protein